MQGRVHHRHCNIDVATLRQLFPFFQQGPGDVGRDWRVACDAARIERGRHDAPVVTPGLAFAGQQPAAEARLEDAAADFGLGVVRGVIQHHAPDRVGIVEDEHAAPQNPLFNDIGVEALRRIGGRGVFAHGAERLP